MRQANVFYAGGACQPLGRRGCVIEQRLTAARAGGQNSGIENAAQRQTHAALRAQRQ